MSERVKQATYLCEKYEQQHLIKYLRPQFSDAANDFAKQILALDLAHMNNLYNSLSKSTPELDATIKEITPAQVTDILKINQTKRRELIAKGLEAIKKGEVAAITMAGGEGTRLGHSGPKGTFCLDLNPSKSLFEIQANQLIKLYEKTNEWITWLIMTSQSNNEQTIKFFDEHNYFGYDKYKIKFFIQEMLPALDLDGKLLVKNKEIITSPNGNGGVFSSLSKSGYLENLKNEGIKRVFVCGIDNPLVKISDPLFIGFSIDEKTHISCKSTLKRSWDEHAGVFCKKNGKPSYVEYTEISSAQAKSVNDNDEFIFGDVGIVMYVYHIDVLEKISQKSMPYHEARKKIPFTNENGDNMNPKIPNGIKYETFIFDSFKFVDDVSILRVKRNEEFAPIKNAKGLDSPQIATKLYLESKNTE